MDKNNKKTELVNRKITTNDQVLIDKSNYNNKRGKKLSSSSSDHGGGTKNKLLLKSQTTRNEFMHSNSNLSNNFQMMKKNVKTNDDLNVIIDHQNTVRKSTTASFNSNHGNVRSINNTVDYNCTSKDFSLTRSSKDHHHHHHQHDNYESKNKNYSTCTNSADSDYGKLGNNSTNNHHHHHHHSAEYKSRNNNNINNNNNTNLSQLRYSNQESTGLQLRQRDLNNTNKILSTNDKADLIGLTTTTTTTTANYHKALEQQQQQQQNNLVPKMGQINFPPLRAPQSIVNVRHPFVTESRIKQQQQQQQQNEQKSSNVVTNCLKNSQIKESIEHNNTNIQNYHGYSSSPIATNIQNVANLSNMNNLGQYQRPDSFPQQTLASLLFSETSQFPQSPTTYATQQVGQINQFQAYDPASFTPTPVNVNSVIPQFSAESSQLSYPQFENPQYVQTNHYPTPDMANSQFQYQTVSPAAVPQIPDSSLYLQSLQSPLTAVAEQYPPPPNYAQAVRTELIPRLRRPPRFNK